MARKPTASSKTQFLIAWLFVALFGSCTTQSSSPKISVRLEQLLSGVSFDEQMRLKVKDISVGKDGKASVKDLFQISPGPDPSAMDRYFWVKKNTKSIVIKDAASLERLRQTLAAQHSDELTVTLVGDQDDWWRKYSEQRYDQWNSTKIAITILPTPCDEINRIIYDRINSAIHETVQKQIDEKIDLDQIFDLLLHNELKPYLAKLESGEIRTDDDCFKTFRLLEWLKGQEIPRFRSGEYAMVGSLQGLLDPAINALIDTRSNWMRYNLGVKVVGYTDDVPVRKEKIDLLMERTGIDNWSNIEKPLDVHYLGCKDDNLNGKEPAFVRVGSSEGQEIRQKISNNCELGAVRAYIAVVYIKNRLGWQDVEYSYATGGIAPEDRNSGGKYDSQRRKIHIEFHIKAARTDD